MDSLGIEGLSKPIQIIDSGSSTLTGPGFEQRVQREMLNNGMQVPEAAVESSGGVQGPRTFADLFEKSVAEVNQNQVDADRAIKELIAGRNKNPHEVMLAVERADVSLKLMTQVRNKILDAYKEIMKMQV